MQEAKEIFVKLVSSIQSENAVCFDYLTGCRGFVDPAIDGKENFTTQKDDHQKLRDNFALKWTNFGTDNRPTDQNIYVIS